MYDEKSKNRTMRYLDKLKRIQIRVQPEEYERWETAANKAGYPSFRQFVIAALDEKAESVN